LQCALDTTLAEKQVIDQMTRTFQQLCAPRRQICRHASRRYGRYQGYAWIAVLAVGGVGYALGGLTNKKEEEKQQPGGKVRAGDIGSTLAAAEAASTKRT
jgi:hypothetical protein